MITNYSLTCFHYIWTLGMGTKPLFPYEIKHKYLEMKHNDMKSYINIQTKKMEDLCMHNNV